MFNSLKSRILISVLGILTITTLTIIFFVHIAAKETLTEAQNENAKNLVKTVMLNVENEYQSILFHKKILLDHRKNELKNVTNLVFDIIDSYYKKIENGDLSEKEAKLEIISFINKSRYDNGTGYFWINDTGYPFPKMIVHPTIPELNGNILDNEEFNCAYGKGVNLFTAAVETCRESGDGYVDYLWPKPVNNELTSEQPKISYVKLFKKWNWIIGSGLYIDDIEKDVEIRINAVLDELKETFTKIQIAENGYMYIFDSNKTFLIHPVLQGKNGEFLINPVTGKPLLDELIEASLTPETPYEYIWNKPDSPDMFKFRKQAYINYFKPLDWYIASSIYIDEIEAPINKLSRQILILSLIFLTSAYIFSILLSQSLTKPLRKLMTAVHQIEKNGIPDGEIPVSGTMETRELGILLGSMIKSIKTTGDQLRQAQKMEIVGTLAGGLAHDFNNMLGGIIGTLSLMEFNISNNGKIENSKLIEYIETMNDCGQRASTLVHQLLALSRKQELSFSNVDLNNTVKNVYKICSNSFDKSVKLISRYSDTPAFIKADPTQIEQTLLNFCVNAEHSMTIMRNSYEKWGGELIVSIKEIIADSYFRRTHPEVREGKYYILSVKDTGIGMDSNTISKIFNPFFTTKKKGEGSGLGLSMVYNIINQHGGFIDVYSEPGVGSSFNIYLPAIENNILNENISNKKQILPKGDGLILIVDDEKVMRETAAEILETCGYRTLEAVNGKDGIEVYMANREEITAVLLDMVMPEMSGKEAYIKLKEINPDIKVILSSGFQQDKRVQEVLILGVNSFIQKPYTLKTLSEAIDKLLK